MGFSDELVKLVEDPAIRRLALRRARHRELAEDALQETFRAVAQAKRPEAIEDLRAFFCKSLIRVINRQLMLSMPIPAGNIDEIADRRQGLSLSAPAATTSVADEAELRILVKAAVDRLDRERAELMAIIPARSGDPWRYRNTIMAAAEKILRLLVEGPVTKADWNAILGSEYPRWCDEPGLAHEALYQRLSRARADIEFLLRAIVPRG